MTDKRKADIAELDHEALRLRVTWKKIHTFVRSFAVITLDTQQKFKTTDYGVDKYGIEWTFNTWLGFKAGLVESNIFRLLNQFEKRLATDERETIANEKRRMADEKRQRREPVELAKVKRDLAAAQQRIAELEYKLRRDPSVTKRPRARLHPDDDPTR